MVYKIKRKVHKSDNFTCKQPCPWSAFYLGYKNKPSTRAQRLLDRKDVYTKLNANVLQPNCAQAYYPLFNQISQEENMNKYLEWFLWGLCMGTGWQIASLSVIALSMLFYV